MALVAAWNATTDINMRYAPGGKTGKLFGANNAFGTDGTAISGNSIAMTSTGNKAAIWTARKNSSANRGQAFVVRYSPTYTGAPAATKAIFSLSGGVGRVPAIEMTHLITTGNIVIRVVNELLATSISNVSAGAWSPTSGVWYDIGISWDGTTGANSFIVTIDDAVFGTLTPTQAFSASWSNEFFSEIVLGGSDVNSGAATQKYEEWAWYDTAVDFTADVALASGNGALNGAARTSLISDVAGAALTVLDGYNTTDPGVSKVLTSAGTYYIAGVLKTPTYDDTNLTNANMKTGVTFGVSGSGTYDGTDRHTHPTEAQVESGVVWKDNSLTNNKTGTLSASGGGNIFIPRR